MGIECRCRDCENQAVYLAWYSDYWWYAHLCPLHAAQDIKNGFVSDSGNVYALNCIRSIVAAVSLHYGIDPSVLDNEIKDALANNNSCAECSGTTRYAVKLSKCEGMSILCVDHLCELAINEEVDDALILSAAQLMKPIHWRWQWFKRQ